MRAFALLLLCSCVACNAIDGADQYKKGDAAGTCAQSCIDTAGTCLAQCTETHATCTAGCGNSGCKNKCDSAYGSCTNDCVSTCTGCNCSQSDCENATPKDASSD